MELIYLYIRNYESVFENEEFNFSSNYIAALKDRRLSVHKNEKAVNGYYGENVNNVVMFFGQNGMGKSTLLDILGMKRNDRSKDTYESCNGQQRIKSSYFMLYYLYDDYFGFEFVDDSFVKGNGRIENLDMQGASENGALYKLPMGTVFKLEDGIFKYCDNILLQWLRNQDVNNKVEYAYFTSDKYNTRIGSRYKEYDYLFERKYYLEGNSYQYLYQYFVKLEEIHSDLLKERSISIINIIKVDENLMERERETVSYLYDRKNELDQLFGLKDRIQIQMEELSGVRQEPDERCMKDKFLHTFYAELIEYYFLEQLVGWSENEGQKIDIHTPIPDMDDFELEVSSLDEKDRGKLACHRLLNFQNEYIRLLYIIKRNTDESGAVDLKSVLRYTLSRVETAAKETVDIGDKEAVLQLAALLEALPEHYFQSRKKIEVNCDTGKTDEKIIELLKWYDHCFMVRNDEGSANCISKIVTIQTAEMSEGYRVFLDLISRTVSAVYSINPGDSLVLLMDEPDRSLHPELSRKFLDTLLDCIHQCKDRKVQIVLTSHSPFIVTDVLPESVYAIDSEDGRRKIKRNRDTFATNIYYLLMDSFMLKNTFGEYSYKQLKHMMELLNSNNHLESGQLEWIEKVIDRIGEKAVRNKMMQLYQKREENRSELAARILKETDESKIKKIREILRDHD
ncbi:hypothetical protein D7X88_04935 [bacterium C-53]|nr:hypothetical protein [Lachnospiraceae bacterium]RKJ11654.1 hypothetical protein D7X88_04935 [bacterium C-53]